MEKCGLDYVCKIFKYQVYARIRMIDNICFIRLNRKIENGYDEN